MRARRMLWILGGVVVVFAALSVGSAYYVSGLFIRPPWLENRSPEMGLVSRVGDPWADKYWQGVVGDPETDFGLPYDDIEFEADDGSTLRGWLVHARADPRLGIVTAHGGGSDRREYLRMLPILNRAGYPVLLFDFREHGVSDGSGRGISLGVREHRDVIAAVRHLRQTTGVARVAVIGGSMGGASVILAAAESDEIDAVIAEHPAASLESWVVHMLSSQMGQAIADDFAAQGEAAPALLRGAAGAGWWSRLVVRFVTWRIDANPAFDPVDVIHRIAPRPLLLMHGKRDRMVPVSHAYTLFARASHPKELWIHPDSDHESFFNLDPDAWSARVLSFLEL